MQTHRRHHVHIDQIDTSYCCANLLYTRSIIFWLYWNNKIAIIVAMYGSWLSTGQGSGVNVSSSLHDKRIVKICATQPSLYSEVGLEVFLPVEIDFVYLICFPLILTEV